ncbi:MAG TPA: ornithine carbamoyltransferase [Alphaproteobacteria bacterium]|nr:ornithine carbamoyltransferase [Alphaproteobacteria bacterium]
MHAPVKQPAKTGRDFLDLDVIDPAELKAILKHAHQMKKSPLAFQPMVGKTLALIFEKPSTRTRVSFEVGFRQLGGHVTTLSGAEIQLGHGETISDTGRVLSRFTDIIMLRTFASAKLYELANGASVPVINGLTDASHPCQVMADIMAVEERLGTLTGKTVVWVGDGGDNVLVSWIHAAPVFDFTLKVVCPPEFVPPKDVLIVAQKKGARISMTADVEAVKGADIIITDCWVSMHNSDAAARHERLAPYQVNAELMAKAGPKAIFLHCLPAHRGEEVTDEVIDGPQSVVWDEAENRMHVQKAIVCWCMGVKAP